METEISSEIDMDSLVQGRKDFVIKFTNLKGIPSYFFLFLKKIVHDPTKNKLCYLIL